MAESKATIPDFTLAIDVDMEECVALRAELKRLAAEGARVAADLQRHGRQGLRAGAARAPARERQLPRRRAAAALARQRRRRGRRRRTRWSCRRCSTPTRSRSARSRARRARWPSACATATITPPELGGGTFTVSNLGMFGVAQLHRDHQPAAGGDPVGRGARARARSSPTTARSSRASTMTLTLVCDHRILYGADAAQFLARVRELLQTPAALTL